MHIFVTYDKDIAVFYGFRAGVGKYLLQRAR